MSAFYDLASLVVVPSGYKASKVYAQKPLTTDGQLAFSRSTTATRVNSAGLIEEVAINVPRLDYLNSSCPRLLLEPQRTNSATYSEQFDNAAWVKQTATTISSNVTTSPDGYTNADKLVNSTSVNRQAIYQNSSLTGVVSFSVFAKKSEYDVIQLTDGREPTFFANFDLTNGVLGSFVGYTASMENYGNGWYRCAVSANYGALTINQPRISLAQTPTEARLVEFAGSGTDGLFLYGCQIEAGAYATSYIPTLAAAVTRGADAASKTGISSLIGQTEGTLFAEVNANATGINQDFTLGDGTANNQVGLRLEGPSKFQLYILQAGVVVFSEISVATFAQGQNLKMAAVYKSGAVTQFFVNGVSVLSATAGTITGNLSGFFSGRTGGTLNLMSSPVKQILVFPTALTNTQAIELTA